MRCGLGDWQGDIAIGRDFPIYERVHLQFRAEAFNILNDPVFGAFTNWNYGPYNPQTLFGFGGAFNTLNNNLAGLNSLYQSGGPRSLQIALKLSF
jgi:hypothetical protein